MLSRQTRATTKLFVLVSALLLVLTSCTASVFGAERNTGYLVVALAGQTGILDPTQSSTFDSRIVFANLCEKLYDVNAALQIVPELAAGLPKISADGLTYDITVRAGIKFNDGSTFDANAVRTSLLRDKTDPLARPDRLFHGLISRCGDGPPDCAPDRSFRAQPRLQARIEATGNAQAVRPR